ncbi:MAG: hypothetical protein FWB86_12545 [Treponema sp.]|nr:hypothetical protein [Treponema sp.]MCL2252595.1 hypothetical protein [Treponema sp.]
MTAAILRKEIHSIIDAIPDQSLPAIKPLLTHLAYDYWKPVVEAANPEEIAMIDEGMEEYRKNPKSFIPLDRVK